MSRNTYSLISDLLSADAERQDQALALVRERLEEAAAQKQRAREWREPPRSADLADPGAGLTEEEIDALTDALVRLLGECPRVAGPAAWILGKSDRWDVVPHLSRAVRAWAAVDTYPSGQAGVAVGNVISRHLRRVALLRPRRALTSREHAFIREGRTALLLWARGTISDDDTTSGRWARDSLRGMARRLEDVPPRLALPLLEENNHLGIPRAEVALANHDAAVRAGAAWALGEMSGSEAVDRLVALLLRDPAPAVRQAGARALRKAQAPQALGVMMSVLDNREERAIVRAAVAEAFADFKDRRVIAPLRRALSSSSVRVRFWSAHSLRWQSEAIEDEEMAAQWRKLITSDDAVCPGWWSLKLQASDALNELEARAAASALSYLQDLEPPEVARQLQRLHGDTSDLTPRHEGPEVH